VVPASLILRHRLRRLISLVLLLLTIPALRRSSSSSMLLVLQRNLRSSSSTIHLLLHVRAKLDILAEITDVAGDGVPGLEAEGDDGDEAEGEPFPVVENTLAFLWGMGWGP
jgi:hypothetical protein